MTEAQAMSLARQLFEDRIRPGMKPKQFYESEIDAIKEALMSAYNDGWENGFEEHGTITPMGSTKWR